MRKNHGKITGVNYESSSLRYWLVCLFSAGLSFSDSRLSIILSLKSLFAIVKIEASSKDGELLQHVYLNGCWFIFVNIKTWKACMYIHKLQKCTELQAPHWCLNTRPKFSILGNFSWRWKTFEPNRWHKNHFWIKRYQFVSKLFLKFLCNSKPSSSQEQQLNWKHPF